MKKTFTAHWAAVLLAVLALAAAASGCSMVQAVSGDGGRSVMDLDEAQDFRVELERGERLVLDVRNPGSGGYEFTGALFDPAVLELEHFVLQPPGEGEAMPGNFGRAQYEFLAVGQGQTTVEIRIRRPWEKGSAPEVYKSVDVLVDGGGG